MKRKTRIILSLFLVAAIAVLLVGCNKQSNEDFKYEDIESITVDERLTADDFVGFSVDTFDISQITLYIKLKDKVDAKGNVTEVGATIQRQAQDYMLKAEDRIKIQQAGTKTITLIYGKHEISFTLKLYEGTLAYYTVCFFAEDGVTQLGQTQQVVQGGRATQPDVPAKSGYTFIGWTNAETGKSTTFDNVTSDMSLIATYEANNTTVEYFYKNGAEDVLIASVTIARGDSGEFNYPAPPEREGYLFTNWRKDSSVRFYAEYEPVAYYVTFIYRKYAGGKYEDTFSSQTIAYLGGQNEIVPPNDYKPDNDTGNSEADDYKFEYWYVKHGTEKLEINFPVRVENTYEFTFYAQYVDLSVGSEGLQYKRSADSCMISGYTGDGGVVAIPEKYLIEGVLYDVTSIGDGVFKSVRVTEFLTTKTNRYFATKNGVLYNADYSVLYAYPSAAPATSYTVESETEELNPYAFYNAVHLKTVTLNERLVYIRDYAFRDCVQLEKIIIPENVENIGEGAFRMSGSSKLKSVIFEGTEITSIGDEAFYGLNALEVLTLPASLTSIGEGVFYGCSSLTRVDATRNAYFTEFNGALYDSEYRTLYVYPAKYSAATNPVVVLHEDCRTVSRGAFYFANISCVTIRSNLSLETYSIVCPTLRYVCLDTLTFTLNENLFTQAFGEYLPKTIYIRERGTFYSSTIPTELLTEWHGVADYYQEYAYAVRTVARDTTSGQEEDREITITAYNGASTALVVPATIGGIPVVEIGENAFNGNDSLASIELPVTVLSIGNNAFMNCKRLRSVVVNGYSGDGLTVGNKAFYGCESLTSMNIASGASFTSFGEYVFEGTPIMDENAEFVVVGGVLVAYNGSDLSVEVPTTVSYIATDAFKDKGFITEIVFPTDSALVTVDAYAFLNCTGLKELSFPSGIRNVRNRAFYGCDYLYRVYYGATQDRVTVASDAYYQAGSHYRDGVHPEYLGGSTGELDYHAKEQITARTGIAFVEAITPEITPSELFVGWYYDETYSSRVDFPVSVEPGDVLHVYARIVEGTYVSDGLLYSRNEDGTYTIIGYTGTDNHLIIGENYMGARVVGIDKNAFGETVVAVKIPNQLNLTTSQYVSNILTIGLDAFTKTSWYQNIAGDFVIYDNLLLGYKGDAKNVVIPNSVSVLAEGVFKNNKSIESVVFSSNVRSIPKETFYGCTGLKSVILGAETSSIDDKAFYGCTNLSDVNFTELHSLASIASDALDNTAWLHNVTGDCVVINSILYKYFGTASTLHVPSNVTIISENVFKNNADISEVYLPSGLTTIRSSAFEGAISLKAVYLPSGASLAYILENAFKNCFNLITFDFASSNSLTEISDGAFENTTALSQLTITPNLIRLGSYSFKNSGVEQVVGLDDGRLTTIDEGAFYGCRSLKSFEFVGANVLGSVGSYGFYECTSLEKFLVGTANVSKIGDYAFYNCRSLTQVEMNEKALTSLGTEAVYRMGYVSSQKSNLVLFGNILVSYSGTDKIVRIPANVTLIYDSAFEGNTNITTIWFESDDTLTTINDRAFYGCTYLETIEFPSSLQTVGYHVMDGTAWYAEQLNTKEYVTINNTLVKYNVSNPRQAEVPANVTKIIRGAFDGARVYDIKIGANVREVEDGAFEGIVPVVWQEEGKYYSGWTLTIISGEPFVLSYNTKLPACRAIYVVDELTYSKYILDEQWLIQSDLIHVIDKYTIKYEVVPGEADFIASESVHALYNAKDVHAYRTTAKQFVFVGWFKDANYSEAVTYPYILTADTTIYAKCIDYDDGSNPEDYILAETDDGRYTIISYHDDTDKNVVIITEQSDMDIYSITGYLGYVKYSGDGTKESTKYVYDESSGAYLEEITYVLMLVPYTYVVYDPDAHLSVLTYYAYDNRLKTYYPYDGVTYFYDDSIGMYLRYTSARGDVQQYLYDGVTESYVAYTEHVYYIMNDEMRYEEEPDTFIFNQSSRSFTAFDRTEYTSYTTRYVYNESTSAYVPYDGTVFVYDGTTRAYVRYRATEHSGMTLYLYDETTETYVEYSERIRYILDVGTGEYIPEPTKYVLIKDTYSFVRYDAEEHASVLTQYVFDADSGEYVPYKGVPFVFDENTGEYVLYVANRHAGLQQYLYDEYYHEYVEYVAPQVYVYDENQFAIIPYDENASSDTIRRYVYDNEERAFVFFDPYGSYPEGTAIYRRNTLIEEIGFANNCTIEVLGDNCFAGMTNLKKVTIPASVKYISANAFSDCVSLREIVFAEGISGLVIEEGAFRNCVNLQSIVIPAGITTLANESFVGCTALTEIYLESETPIVLYNDAMPFEINEGLRIYIPYGRTANYSSNWSAYYEYLVEMPQKNQDE